MKKNEQKQQAEAELRERGAVLEKREDRHGDTKSGWWMDGVYLGPKNDPAYALRVLNGGG